MLLFTLQELIAGNYKWFTYQQCQNMINKIGAAILHLEMAPKNELGVCTLCNDIRLRQLF